MSEWKARTGGKVSFAKLDDTGWNDFQVGIHAIGVEKIYDYSGFSSTTSGDAYVGYGGGERPVRIKTGLDGDDLTHTVRHELGHTLGLVHEHQRYDRNDYLKVSGSGSDWNVIPKYLDGWRWEWLHVRVGLWTVSIPYLDISKNSVSF